MLYCPDRWHRSLTPSCKFHLFFLCLFVLLVSPELLWAQTTADFQTADNSAPISLTQQATELPPPLDPSAVFATQAEINQQNLRIQQLEEQLRQMQTSGSDAGLEPGRLRSTDVPKVSDLLTQPAFPKIKLTGFFHADAGIFSQDIDSREAFGDVEDVLGFRRARLAAVGDVSESISYMLEMDFASPGRPSFMDVWMDVHDVPVLGNVRVGQYRMPFGMDALTSVRELTFLERASPFAFNPFRQIGAGFHDNNEAQTVTWAASGFGFPTDTWGDNVGDNGYGLASRITALPYFEDDGCHLLHVGFDYALTRPSTRTLQYRNQPEFGGPFVGPSGNAASVPFFVDTGAMSATSSNLLNAELAGVWNHAYIQSELTYALVELTNGDSVTFPGYYVHAGYFLTGEQRSYNRVAGVLGRVKPLNSWGEPGGYGALELAARYSYLNLSNDGINGGRMNNVTLGVNWYLNQYAKLQLNYIRSMVDQATVEDTDTDIIGMRAQVDF